MIKMSVSNNEELPATRISAVLVSDWLCTVVIEPELSTNPPA
jgi:hypothetical protein